MLDGNFLDVVARRCGSNRMGLRPFDDTFIPPSIWGCPEARAMVGTAETRTPQLCTQIISTTLQTSGRSSQTGFVVSYLSWSSDAPAESHGVSFVLDPHRKVTEGFTYGPPPVSSDCPEETNPGSYYLSSSTIVFIRPFHF